MKENHKQYIKRCLELAQKGAGYVSPNPKVGAVVVKNGKIIGEGYHQKFGGPHAEVLALKDLSIIELQNTVLYVNLEPCCCYGKTPPCTDLILQKKVRQVVVGMIDPNPVVNGQGIETLQKAGVEVKVGTEEKSCRELNRAYIKYITTGIPEVILKAANTLDGRIGTVTGASRWISDKSARVFTHKLRAQYDAVLVGVGTILSDDPMLNMRHVKGRSPLRVILDTRLRTPLSAKVLSQMDKFPSLFFVADDLPLKTVQHYLNLGAKIIQVPLDSMGTLSLSTVLKHLGTMRIISVLVEGGKAVFTSFLKQKLADRLIIALAPKMIGADGIPLIGKLGITQMSEIVSWKYHRIFRLGQDVVLDIILREY